MLTFLKRDLRMVVVAVAASLVTAIVTALVTTSVGPANAHSAARAHVAHNVGGLQDSAPKTFVKNKSILWAAVNEQGNLVRGKGAVSAKRLSGGSDGRYIVRFNRRVNKCTWQATIASVDTNLGFVEIENYGSSRKTVLYVGTYATDANYANKPFHLLVTC